MGYVPDEHAPRDSSQSASSARVEDVLTLLEWKRQIFSLYQEARISSPEEGWMRWREVRDDFFRSHPQSPIPNELREGFVGLDYFPYDESWRALAEVVPVEIEPVSIGASGGQSILFERFAEARFSLGGKRLALDLYWLEGYGGGLFLPFSDATSGSETYPAGRYLLDTVKGADLGSLGARLVLDFNFAYNPSCAYDPHWVCPRAPTANRLAVSVRAGERHP